MGSNNKPVFRDQQELLRWIDNKLGVNELWGGRQASFVLTREILIELETSFQELEPHIKLKIIFAMLHISPKTLQYWKEPLQNVIEEARKDPDDWVETVADICRQFPDLGLIQCSSKEDSYFHKTLIDLENIVDDKIAHSHVDFTARASFDSQFLPKNIVQSILSSNENPIRHFGIKHGKMARSTKLLEEVKKAAEQQSNPTCKKNHALISSFPIKIRSTAKKLDNSLPMKGFVPSANTLKMSCGFTNESKKYQQRTLLKRTGGAMLIDIAELPNRNRRKRNVETIVVPNEKKKSQMDNKNGLKKEKDAEAEEDNGELKPQMEEEHNNGFLETKALDPNILQQPHQPMQIAQNDQQPAPTTTISPFITTTSSTAFNNGSSSSFLPLESHQPELQTPKTMQMHFTNQLQPPNYPQFLPNSSTNNAFVNQQFNNPHQLPQQFPAAPMNYPSAPAHDNSNILALQQFDGLLKDANKLTTVTYNLIISFLSGNKNNPLQDKLGHLITLPFSESVEFEPLPNGLGMTASLVEIFFQMDYRTGEWKRLRKSRELRPEELNQYGHLFNAKRETEQMQINPFNGQGTSQQWNGNGWNFGQQTNGTAVIQQNQQMPVNPSNNQSFLQNS